MIVCSSYKRNLNALARLTFGASRFASTDNLLRALKWLPIEARIDQRLALLAFRCRQGIAPSYLSSELVPISSLPSRSRLRSSATSALYIPSVRRPTLGGRSFPVAAARVWNKLPSSITSEENFVAFKRRLREHLLLVHLH